MAERERRRQLNFVLVDVLGAVGERRVKASSEFRVTGMKRGGVR